MTVTLDNVGANAASANLWKPFKTAVKMPARARKRTAGKMMYIRRTAISAVELAKPEKSNGNHARAVITPQQTTPIKSNRTKFVTALNVRETFEGSSGALSCNRIGIKTVDKVPAMRMR